MVSLCVAVLLQELDSGISQAIASAWSRNTMLTRNSQWKSFLTFCVDNQLKGLPADDLTIARFLLFKARTVKYSTINNYLSAICTLHRYYGFSADYRGKFFIKMVLDGLKSNLGQSVSQKSSLTIDQMTKMYEYVDKTNVKEMLMWCSLALAFRTLLRKSNLLPEKESTEYEHVILKRDIRRTDSGYEISVYSSKTIRNRSKVLRIPIMRSGNSPMCGAGAIDYCLKFSNGRDDQPLFVYDNKPICYWQVLKFLKTLVGYIGLDPADAGLHSMRRSGAQFLQKIGVSLSDIMFMGDWGSLAVLSYLVTNFDRKLEIERIAAAAIAKC